MRWFATTLFGPTIFPVGTRAFFDLARVWLELGIAYEKRRGQAWLAVERKRGSKRAIAV
jgi:hypothetical protein